MRKSVKKLVTMCSLCALLVAFAVPSASAGYLTSTATVNFGSTQRVIGGDKALYGVEVSGTVTSKTGVSNSGVMGYLRTKGSVFTHTEDSGYACNNGSTSLYWGNEGGDRGTFWAECQAVDGDHAGVCKVTQYTPDAR